MNLSRHRFLALSGGLLLAGLVLTAHPALAQVQVAVIGDSNVRGKGVSTSENYPSQLEAALKARGYNVQISNGGINGDTSGGLLSRLGAAVPAGTQVAVIWIGANDVRRGIPMAQIRANVLSMVSQLKARGIDSYVIRPPVYNASDHKNPALTVPDGHFNAAGYSKMIGKTIGPIQSLVAKAAKKKKAA